MQPVNLQPRLPDEWHSIRRNGIGGSDIAAILGESKYATPLSVYESKVGISPPLEDNIYMEWGRRIEPLIADKFAECHPELRLYRPTGVVYQHSRYPWALATLDGALWDSERQEFGILEIKTGGTSTKREWWTKTDGDRIPFHYFLQAQHYLAVTDLKWGYFARLIGGNDYGEIYFERHEELIAEMLRQGAKFWENVVALVSPEEIEEEF